jgi:hypothetical protein
MLQSFLAGLTSFVISYSFLPLIIKFSKKKISFLCLGEGVFTNELLPRWVVRRSFVDSRSPWFAGLIAPDFKALFSYCQF